MDVGGRQSFRIFSFGPLCYYNLAVLKIVSGNFSQHENFLLGTEFHFYHEQGMPLVTQLMICTTSDGILELIHRDYFT